MTGSGVQRADGLLEALLTSVADGVYLVDPDGRVEFANPAALTMLGYEEHELLGCASHATIHHSHPDGSPFPEEDCPLLRPRATGETVRVEDDCFWRKDGSKFAVSYSSAPLETPAGRGAVVVFRDATEREIHASRARILAAADAERRRIARDLHDGAQQRLVRLLLALRSAPGAPADAVREAEEAIAELRDLVNGVHPAILTTRGLGAAIQSLAVRLPLIVTVSVGERRYDPALEAAAYFVVAEALTNAVKHAGAEEVRVRVDERDGELRIEISDDGRGGADPAGGRGLRGLADRVAAFDGTLDLRSPVGDGTRVRVAIPLP